jgi:hypothetical protein
MMFGVFSIMVLASMPLKVVYPPLYMLGDIAGDVALYGVIT